ncbi:LacI family DNA-binding transcriptional regulator [Ruficoccus amylovorans]|uniref:LacI family DNA-binding transcriptional regulator n=1 Tax=Ruficoccus amylovorans TaxID=1804625 RepID=A0A842HBT4_9BACT|nr:LacI family DNA-binding transcriptional regulator [Ruficoccus amylovorans]MBC2593166.1 LacI family DNA-binding transcriptional regulator [Ruficoccus amylovorans]
MDIREFSTLVGVSTATVSRAFSGRGRISKKTQERILREAHKHGFSPNINARRLSSKLSGVIGLYYTFGDEIIFDYYNMELAQEIAKTCAEHSVSLHLVLRSQSRKDLQLNHLVAGKGLDGVIIVTDSLRSLEGLEDVIRKCATVVISNQIWPDNPSRGFIHLDFESGINQAVSHLVRLGHRRIGFIRGQTDESKFDAYRRALKQNGIRFDKSLVTKPSKTILDGQQAISGLLKEGITAVMCCTDLLAFGALQGALGQSVSVPGDLSIVGMDDLALSSQTVPSLSSIGVPRARIAEGAVKMLDQLIDSSNGDRQDSAQFMHTVSTFLIERASIGPVKMGRD